MLLYSWLEKAVKSKGSARALVYRDTYLSWRGLKHRVDRRAREFASTGVRPGDLVGLMLGNVPDFVILTLALSKLRAAPVPLDPTTSTRELEMLMAIIPIRGLITRPRGGDAPLPNTQSANDGTQGAPPSSDPPETSNGSQRLAPESRKRLQGTLLSCSIYPTPEPTLPRKKTDQVAAVLVTADCVGDPKPVERTAGNLAAEAENLTHALNLTEEDRALLTVPLFHSFGFDIGMVACFANSATLCLEDEIAPHRVIKLVREHKTTVLPGNLTLFNELARSPAWRPLTHKPLRLISAGGGLSGGALSSFHQKYGARPMACLHTTESGTVSIDVRGQAGNTVGKVLEGIEVRTTDPKTGKPLTGSKRGALWVRGAAVSPLQLSPSSHNGRTGVPVGCLDEDGWLRTGEIASIDRSKRIKLHGREDDLVRVDGKRIALGEVEGCIEAIPKVSAAQATLVTDPLGGPMVVAKVVLKDRRRKLEPEAIIDHCAKNLAPYKVPRRIEICEKIAS
jgi:long-chain acyl-CoA synthetase